MMCNEDITQQEQNDQYLQQNPHIAAGLWAEWVRVVCGWDKIAHPTTKEWTKLKAKYYHGKAPIHSVGELKNLRIKE